MRANNLKKQVISIKVFVDSLLINFAQYPSYHLLSRHPQQDVYAGCYARHEYIVIVHNTFFIQNPNPNGFFPFVMVFNSVGISQISNSVFQSVLYPSALGSNFSFSFLNPLSLNLFTMRCNRFQTGFSYSSIVCAVNWK